MLHPFILFLSPRRVIYCICSLSGVALRLTPACNLQPHRGYFMFILLFSLLNIPIFQIILRGHFAGFRPGEA